VVLEAEGFGKSRRSGMTAEKRKILVKLFLSTLYISTFTFGGGFVIITFMKKKFVDEYHWIEEEEMLDLAALAQSSPGAIAVNAAILVGWRMGGFLGMLTAVFGTIIPPMIILSVISFFYAAFATNTYIALLLKGMQAGVAAVILDVVCTLGAGVVKNRNIIHYIVMVMAFLMTFVWGINVIYIILAAAFTGVCLEMWKKVRGKKE
jgi:chromate transporter